MSVSLEARFVPRKHKHKSLRTSRDKDEASRGLEELVVVASDMLLVVIQRMRSYSVEGNAAKLPFVGPKCSVRGGWEPRRKLKDF